MAPLARRLRALTSFGWRPNLSPYKAMDCRMAVVMEVLVTCCQPVGVRKAERGVWGGRLVCSKVVLVALYGANWAEGCMPRPAVTNDFPFGHVLLVSEGEGNKVGRNMWWYRAGIMKELGVFEAEWGGEGI